MKKKLVLFGFVVLSIGLIALYYNKKAEDVLNITSADEKQAQTTELNAEEKKVKKVLEENIAAATAKDSERYVNTLTKAKRAETKKEMDKFFKEYTVVHSLQSFQVLKEDKTHMLVEAKQKAINKGKKSYRNHIATADHTFVKENGEWKIDSTTMTDTQFLE
ncbi:MAG: hypothetical protein LBM95_03765 [Lactobacillales bacterium]|jgi:hypothetical protein|nr:hypothetical protein [Lactobacillales bacterium]